MFSCRGSVAGVCAALLALSSASGAIIGTTGAATHIATPASALPEVISSDTQVFAWDEDQFVTLPGPLTVNAVLSGVYNNPASLISPAIPAGYRVASHYIHFDPVAPEIFTSTASGTVTFDADIIAVIVLGDGGPTYLDDSDYLGSSTLYPDGLAIRGVELSANSDSFGISPSRRVLSFNFVATNPGDAIRVITEQVPAPTGVALIGATGVCLGARRRR